MSSEVVQQRISGALAAAATPLRDDGARLDEDAFGSLLQFYAASGLDGVLVLGTTGEGTGVISGVAAAFPEQVSALVHDPTAERAELVDALRAALSAHPFQSSVKIALALRGLPVRADVRRPLRPLSAAESTRLRGDLERRLGAQALTLTTR